MSSQSNSTSFFLLELDRVLEECYQDTDLTVDDICRQLFTSRAVLHRNLKKYTQEGATSYLMKFRLKKSKLLLADYSLSLTELAYESGFSSLNYFSKSFKKEYKISPSDYRKALD